MDGHIVSSQRKIPLEDIPAMRRPSFQFYPADWQSNPNLKRCTHAEKGIWIDILCLMADGDQYGVLKWPLEEIATAIGVPMEALSGLVKKGVMKGSDAYCEAVTYTPRSGRRNGETVVIMQDQDGPLWYSSRMVIDEYKAAVREKNLPHSFTNAPNGECKGDHPSVHPPVHPSRGITRPITPAAPSSSSSPSDKDSKPNGLAEKIDERPLEAIVYEKGKALLGSGGMVTKLRQAFGKNDVQVNEILDQAKTKQNPAEWLAKVIIERTGAQASLLPDANGLSGRNRMHPGAGG